MRLIDADALLPMMKYATTDNEIGVFPIKIGFNTIAKVIDDAPTVDAVPVRHGKWKLIRMEDDGNGFYTCSNCDRGDIHSPLVTVPYCWYCGARMDADAE